MLRIRIENGGPGRVRLSNVTGGAPWIVKGEELVDAEDFRVLVLGSGVRVFVEGLGEQAIVQVWNLTDRLDARLRVYSVDPTTTQLLGLDQVQSSVVELKTPTDQVVLANLDSRRALLMEEPIEGGG